MILTLLQNELIIQTSSCCSLMFKERHSNIKAIFFNRFGSMAVVALSRVGLKSSMTANGDPFVLMDGA